MIFNTIFRMSDFDPGCMFLYENRLSTFGNWIYKNNKSAKCTAEKVLLLVSSMYILNSEFSSLLPDYRWPKLDFIYWKMRPIRQNVSYVWRCWTAGKWMMTLCKWLMLISVLDLASRVSINKSFPLLGKNIKITRLIVHL